MRVRQVENALDLIELFAREKRALTLTELAQTLAMPKSSMFNLIDTLVARGFLFETRPRGGYYPTRRLEVLSASIMEGDAVLDTIHSELKELAATTGETVLLSVRAEDHHVVYIDVVEAAAPLRYIASIGDRRPLYTTSSGKAILTTYDSVERRAIIDEISFVPYQQSTIRSADELEASLDASIHRGWCEDRAEYASGVMGIGVPLVYGDRRFGLAIAGPIDRLRPHRGQLANELRQAAKRLLMILEGRIEDAGSG